MKKIYLSVSLSLLYLFATGQTTGMLINQVSQSGIMQTVNDLSGENSTVVGGSMVTIQHRVSSSGNNTAATYIKEHLNSYGYTATEINYSSGGRNIIAKKTGLVNPGKIFIIAGHYDAVANHGADDNASGVAAVLEAARIMSAYNFENTVVFALWDEEESGLKGSTNYANTAKQNGDNIQGVLTMDMIGYDGDNDDRYDIDVRNIAGSYQIKNDLLSVTSTYGLALNGFVVDPGTLDSDHSPFWNKGYPAVLLGEAWSKNDICPGYHTSNDRVSDFNTTYFYNMVKLAVGYIVTKAVIMNSTSVINSELPAANIFPNPVSDVLNINFEKEFNGEVVLYNVLGLEVFRQSVQGMSATVNITTYSNGIYILNLWSEGRKSSAVKVLKE